MFKYFAGGQRSPEKRERSEQAFRGFMIFAAVSTFFAAPLSEMSSSQVDPREGYTLKVLFQTYFLRLLLQMLIKF